MLEKILLGAIWMINMEGPTMPFPLLSNDDHLIGPDPSMQVGGKWDTIADIMS